MEKQINIRKSETGYSAEFVGDSEIFNLFGSTVLPLPFTAQAALAVVVEDVKRRNPGARVEVL